MSEPIQQINNINNTWHCTTSSYFLHTNHWALFPSQTCYRIRSPIQIAKFERKITRLNTSFILVSSSSLKLCNEQKRICSTSNKVRFTKCSSYPIQIIYDSNKFFRELVSKKKPKTCLCRKIKAMQI